MPEEQRTKLWGVQNDTDEGIEISFGQLKSRYDVPGYTQDTGVKLICQNTGNGADSIRDPNVDTGGVPIVASYYDYRVKIAGSGQDLTGDHEAPDGEYFTAAIFRLYYPNAAVRTGPLNIDVQTNTEKLNSKS